MARHRHTSSVVESHVTRLWQRLLDEAGHKDPTRTLLPLEGPTEIEIAEIGPDPSAQRHPTSVRTPPPMDGLSERLGSKPGSDFGRRYRIFSQLDEGGMGRVYLAWHHALAREVAVKVLHRDDKTTRRLLFRAEALVTAYLEHPHIVPVYDAVDDCLVMRHVRGASFDRVIAAGAELTRMIEIVLKVCDAVAFAHSRGIIHRDLKAENIMVGEFGEVVVVDWGLALATAPDPGGRWRAPRLERCPSVCAGTPGCLPPEIARGERANVGTATDVHMLGGLLYQILVGCQPFEAENSEAALVRAAGNQFLPLAEAAPGAPQRLARICEMAMAMDPRQRPTVAIFAGELHAWVTRAEAKEAAATGVFLAVDRRPPTGWLHRLLDRR